MTDDTDTTETLIPLGTYVRGFGVVSAVGWVGERYYWFVNGDDVSMFPADMVEGMLP